METIHDIVIIGAGNLATHLGTAMRNAGLNIVQVFSRTRGSAELLSARLQCSYTTRVEDIAPGAHLYLFCITDDALPAILEQFPHKGVFAAHTSGSIPIDVLKNAGLIPGVFYPLQTFTKEAEIDFTNVPVCIEALSPLHLQLLRELAGKITSHVQVLSSGERETLHLAAVFASNFTNHMLAAAHEILQKENIPFGIMEPLVKETIRKALENNPIDVQTGPAVRNNRVIMNKHIERLAALPAFRKIYIFVSESISSHKKTTNP
jgi:predicted short-subunit dehydrogenase-like oxidoreductase (DUF2520 family)